MIWPAMTALQDRRDKHTWGPIPEDGWMDKDEVYLSPVNPQPPPLPFARKVTKTKMLHEVSHKDDDAIDTPEIQGEEE